MRSAILLLAVGALACLAAAQQPPADAAPHPVDLSLNARMARARTVLLKQKIGSDIPFTLITNAISEWPRFTVVDERDKADLVLEISSPDDDSTKSKDEAKTHFGSSSGGTTQQQEAAKPTNWETTVKMLVRDARSNAVLWSAEEKPKSAFKHAKQADNLTAAADRIVRRFRALVEQGPEAAAPPK